MSLGASGKLGDALVFFGWKGLDLVREYVIPTNPQSALQTIQRNFLKAAVAAIHAAQAQADDPLGAADQTAMALLGSTHATPRTWFNEIVKLWCDVKITEKTPIVFSNGTTVNATRNIVNLYAGINEETPSDLAAGKFYLGKTKTNLVHAYTANLNAGVSVSLLNENITGWTSVGDKIYWQYRPDSGDDCEGANSGIYHFVAE